MHTLFYIDDTDADVELLRALLSQRGIRVDAARTGAAGMAGYDPTKHVAVVIDWNLPDVQGLDVAKTLREKHPRCPVAFLSGMFEQEHVAAAATLGIDHCFEKKMTMEHIGRISAFVWDSVAGKAA